MQLKPLIFFASGIAISWGATVSDLLSGISNIGTLVTTLDNTINQFPDIGGSLIDALGIHTGAVSVQTAIDAATSVANSLSTVTEEDGQNVLNAIEALIPGITSVLNDIVAKQGALTSLPIGGIPALVLQDLQNLSTSTSLFENALISKSPADLRAQGQADADKINSVFASAIAVFTP